MPRRIRIHNDDSTGGWIFSGHDVAHPEEPPFQRHTHGELNDVADRGLLGIACFAFVLGFAHEEEFQIIWLCSGSRYRHEGVLF